MKGTQLIVIAASVMALGVQCEAQTQVRRVQVTFSGGYETDRRDNGRPVVLIAAALGVPAEVFRRAFSGVTPARGRAPEPEQVHYNKQALLAVLEPYGITNDELDNVSDYYRYQRERGEIWPVTPARAYAIISNGKIVAFKIRNPGSGYSSAPTASIPGFESVPIVVKVSFSKRFEANGSVSAVSVSAKRKE